MDFGDITFFLIWRHCSPGIPPPPLKKSWPTSIPGGFATSERSSLPKTLGRMMEPELGDPVWKCPRGVLCCSSRIFGCQKYCYGLQSFLFCLVWPPLWSRLVPAKQNRNQSCMFSRKPPEFHEQSLFILRDTPKTLVSTMLYPLHKSGSGPLCRADKRQIKI